MNYILLIEGFNNWLETNHLPVLSQLLWFKLVHLFNKCAWSECIQVDNQWLMYKLQIVNQKTLINSRKILIEKGLIVYQRGKKGSPGKYKLKQTFSAKCNDFKSVQTTVQTTPKTTVQTTTINKLNKTKLNKENISRNTKVLLDIQKKKISFDSRGNVLLTQNEFEKLERDYKESAPKIIEYLSEYIAMKGYKAKSHYLAIKNWVATAYEEQKLRKTKLSNQKQTKNNLPNKSYNLKKWEKANNEFWNKYPLNT